MGDVVVTVLSILGGMSFIGTGIVALSQRRKVRADAASVLTDSALKIVKDLRNELEETRSEMNALREHLGTVEDLLRKQGVPVPQFRWAPPRNGVAG